MAAAAESVAAAREEEFTEVELEVAAILCNLKGILRARDRRRMQRRESVPEIPSWGRRRPRSMPEDSKPAASAAGSAVVAERDGAASPDTPLAFPESGGDDAAAEQEEANKARTHAEWVQEQRGVVASLSEENAHLLKRIEEYRARLQSSRSTNQSLKQLHKVRQKRELEREQERRMIAQRQGTAPGADPRAVALGLDLNEPAPRAPYEEAAAAARAQAEEEWYRQGQQRAALQKAAMTADARRRRLEILRAKVAASPLLSSRTRRVG
ncbi:uncharacterized protein LOC133922802 [Phragmites australis]|uniref:uncharacterized protein LOC133922802 n=1 Tax=Phragmites australis TaxID=29695 RepID=UPI002D794AE8|nr:uncharacterized protein LOC133922802 [Phragmites australis]